MMRRLAPAIVECVSTRWGGAARHWAAGAAFLIFLIGSSAGAAHAGISSLEVGDQPVIQVWARTGSDIAVRTWERPAIQIETDDEQAQVSRRALTFGTVQNPLSVTIPFQNIQTRDANGNPVSGTLPPEDFPFASSMRAGVHDVVHIQAGENTRTTVTVPAGSAIVDARVFGNGGVSIANYRGGTLFVFQNNGVVRLENVAAATFVQLLNGRLQVTDSAFERLRARGNTAAMLFERSRAKQIEVTTQSGPIVFDNGTFDPGLARFQSTAGLIALGINGGAQVNGRSQDGRVYAMFDQRPRFEQRADGDATALIGSGGALVNAVTTRGNIFLYDGSLANRRAVPPEWRPLYLAMQRASGAAAGAENGRLPGFAPPRVPARPLRTLLRTRS
jgi:hypothetical protein